MNFRLLLIIVLFFSCNESVDSLVKKNKDSKRIWVDMQIELKNKNDTMVYYYLGQISETDLYNIKNKNEGMFSLENVRYFDDVVKIYEDDLDSGTLIFRNKDVNKFSILKGDPILPKYKKYFNNDSTKNEL